MSSSYSLLPAQRRRPGSSSRTAALLCLVCASLLPTATQGFQIQPITTTTAIRRISLSRPLDSSKQEIVDVEFERTPDDDDPEEFFTSKKKKKSKKRTTKSASSNKKNKKGFAATTKKEEDEEPQTLFDWSLESGDPEWKEARIPFIDTKASTVIDGTLAFVVELDGIQYGIAKTCDHAAAITFEDHTTGEVTNLHPDNDEHEEIMQIMAAKLVEHVSPNLSLKRTPKVLTIQGDLDKHTKNWEEEILPKPYETQELLDNDTNNDGDDLFDEDELDEEIKAFHDFMRKELGEEEYQKTMNEPVTSEDIGDELMELFEIPGFGTLADDTAGIQEMLREIQDEADPIQATLDHLGDNDGRHPLDHDGAALKLVSYNFRDGTSYSLVKLLKPYTLVGQLMMGGADGGENNYAEGLRFELLTKEEEKLVIPKLEQVCRKELEDAGLDLSP